MYATSKIHLKIFDQGNPLSQCKSRAPTANIPDRMVYMMRGPEQQPKTDTASIKTFQFNSIQLKQVA